MIVGGHSKGGNLALYSSAFVNKKIQGKKIMLTNSMVKFNCENSNDLEVIRFSKYYFINIFSRNFNIILNFLKIFFDNFYI